MIKKVKYLCTIIWTAHKSRCTLYILSFFSLAILATLQLYTTESLVDCATKVFSLNNSLVHLLFPTIAYLAIFFAMAGVSFLQKRWKAKLHEALCLSLESQLLRKLGEINFACFDNSEFNDYIARVREDPGEKLLEVFDCILNVVMYILVFFGIASIFSKINVLLACSLIFTLLISLAVSNKGMEIFNKQIRAETASVRLINYYSDIFFNKDTILELTLFSAQKHILDKRKLLEKQVVKDEYSSAFKADAIYNLSTLLMIGWIIFAIALGANSMITESISLASFTVMIQACLKILSTLETVNENFSDMVRGMYIVECIGNIFNQTDQRENRNIEMLNTNDHIVEFQNVSFAYPSTDHNVLSNISFNVRRGEKVAIVGENGAGKTTIVKLLTGLYSCNSGIIKMHNSLAVVFQNYMKYYLTLRENIAFGDLTQINNDHALYQALSKAGAAAQFESTIDLDTILGHIVEDGTDLSEGQWQAVSLARALLNPASLIILDEPTAALDPIAESKMYESFLNGVLSKQSCIIISHRLISAKLADRIIVLDKGKIAEIGSHQELMEKGGVYSQMYSLQAQWYIS